MVVLGGVEVSDGTTCQRLTELYEGFQQRLIPRAQDSEVCAGSGVRVEEHGLLARPPRVEDDRCGDVGHALRAHVLIRHLHRVVLSAGG